MLFDVNQPPEVLEVPVTNAHILAGKKHNFWFCPLALALQEAYPLPGFRVWVVFTVSAFTTDPFLSYSFDTAAVVFVHRFDEGIPVAPFTAHLTRR